MRPLALCRPRRSQPDFDDPLRRSSVDSSCDELSSTPHLSTSTIQAWKLYANSPLENILYLSDQPIWHFI